MPVAAAYRTLVRHDREEDVTQWRLWRSADRVTREWLRDHTAEVWQRDGATLFRTVLFHDERRGIEFEPADLQMTGAAASWSQQTQLVSPALLRSLRAGKSGWREGVPWREFTGEREGMRWRVRLRMDLMIPMLVEQTTGKQLTRITLLEAYPLTQAPWQPTPYDNYGMLDFADLGDHERDPFVLRAQARMGLGHGHAHD